MHRSGTILVALALTLAVPAAAAARPAWKRKIDRIVRGHAIGVAASEGGTSLYRHADKRQRIPASNEKLLLSMALLDLIGPDKQITTSVKAEALAGGVVRGDLWLLGHGDPSLTGGGAYGRSLPFRAARLSTLARGVKAAGIRRVTGSVRGATNYFSRDWFAPGWKSFFPAYYVARPTALAFEGNSYKGRHISDPERRAARALTRRLRALGIRVAGAPGTGLPPADTLPVADARSEPLPVLLTYTNRQSSNFFAEMLGKRLAASVRKPPGSIAKGAGVIARWTARHGVEAAAHDSSGLSYENRISPWGLVQLLEFAESAPWGPILKETLPVPGQGTLDERLDGVRVRAKTGTLVDVSALSGWVWLARSERWAEFSILSGGMPKSQAAEIEDRIVRILSRAARLPQGRRTTGTLTTWMGDPSSADDSKTSTNPSWAASTWNDIFFL